MPEAEPDHLRPARRRRRPRLYPALLAALLWGNAHAAQTITTQTITVRTGDTLWALAGRYGTTVQAIRAANGLKDDRSRRGKPCAWALLPLLAPPKPPVRRPSGAAVLQACPPSPTR